MENLLVNPELNKLYVTDFGSAKFFEPGLQIKEKEGTLSYLSPELLENLFSTERSDYWSLGIILYGMLTGRFIFNGRDEDSLLDNIKKKVPNLERHLGSISAEAKDLI